MLMKSYAKRLMLLFFGIFVASMGVYATIQANIGLSPWDAFAVGLSKVTGLTVGSATILVSLASLLAVLLLRETIGLSALMNAVVIGLFLDLFLYLELLPECSSYWTGVPMLLAGLLLISLGTYAYIVSAFGGGPRDAIAIGLAKRLKKAPIGILRAAADSLVLFAGWLLGAKIGVGTVLSAFGLGIVMQLVFRAFRLDMASVDHESLLETGRKLYGALRAIFTRRVEAKTPPAA